MKKRGFYILILLFLYVSQSFTQEQEKSNNINTTWLILQSVPSLTWTSFTGQTNFAFEWEATPVIYSFGMNKQNPPWNFFNVTPPERFTGSVEFNISGQLFTSKVGSSHWGYSGQLLVHLPLIEYGENLGLNLGIARYFNSVVTSNFIIVGFSTLFGFFHYNIKYSPETEIWINAIEFRFF
jgi:hypothetical protein